MTTLAKNTPPVFDLGDINDLPVIASDIIYQGSAVGDNASGYMRPLVSGDKFRGFCLDEADNADGSAGDINVHIQTKGKIKLSVTSLAITDVGRPVYASDDAAFALTGIGSFVGHIHRYVSAGVGIIKFDANEDETDVIVCFPITLSSLADGDIISGFTPGFNGRIKALDFTTNVPASTASKLSTLNAEIGTADITGGTVELTTAACDTLGEKVTGAAITAGAGFKDTDTISIEASSTTSFVEGTGVLLLTLGK